MPDIPDRDELERKLAEALGKLNRAHMAKLLEYMGDPPDINKIPPEFWNEAGEEIAKALLPFSEGIYLDAAERMLADTTIGVDWGMVNQSAADFARRHSYDVSYAMARTRNDALQKLVPRYFEEGWTQGELRKRLTRWYGPVRSEMIARTEVTRAAVQGELSFVDEIRKQGIEMIAIWQTRHDEIVCELCGPLHNKKKGDGWNEPPPRHPRCRCWLNHEIV